jgi:hypothetical protein
VSLCVFRAPSHTPLACAPSWPPAPLWPAPPLGNSFKLSFKPSFEPLWQSTEARRAGAAWGCCGLMQSTRHAIWLSLNRLRRRSQPMFAPAQYCKPSMLPADRVCLRSDSDLTALHPYRAGHPHCIGDCGVINIEAELPALQSSAWTSFCVCCGACAG